MEEVSKYETFFSNWLSENMPPVSNWYFISNIDYLLFNYFTKKFVLLELKTRWNNITEWQKNMYNMLHKRLSATNWTDWYIYIWTYLITFTWDDFYDWIVSVKWSWINRVNLQEYELKSLLKWLLM